MSRSKLSPSVSPNTGPDVSQLANESLSAVTFPVSRAASFRVHFDPQVYSSMKGHASEDVSFEICGVLVGDWGRDTDGPFVTVRNYIRCDSAAKKFAEVTFTHESWSHINKEMDTKFQDQRIVGWYHSHPNFGIFLSDRDLFIQQNFFSGPGQIALVIDPVRKIEGVFEWRNGHASPSPHYWVGTEIQLAPPGSDVTGMPEAPMESSNALEATPMSAYGSPNGAAPSPTLMMLAGMGLFLMGWILAGWRTSSEQRSIIEGTVAHFGIWKGLRPDLDVELRGVQKELDSIAGQIKPLALDHLSKATKEAEGQKEGGTLADKTRQDWKKTLQTIDEVRDHLKHIDKLYLYTPEEFAAVRQYVEQKILEVSKGSARREERSSGEREPVQNGSKPNSKKSTDNSAPEDKTDRKNNSTKK